MEVPDRHPAEDAVTWVKTVSHYVSAEHRRRSPFCRAATFDLKIPFSAGATRLGEPLKQ
jgi:hypothetical protein